MNLKKFGYIDDRNYIERAVNEFKNLKNMSIREIEYKLLTKGLKKDLVTDYIYKHKDELEEYELSSARNIFIKKQNTLEQDEIVIYLKKKGYMDETIKLAKDLL